MKVVSTVFPTQEQFQDFFGAGRRPVRHGQPAEVRGESPAGFESRDLHDNDRMWTPELAEALN